MSDTPVVISQRKSVDPCRVPSNPPAALITLAHRGEAPARFGGFQSRQESGVKALRPRSGWIDTPTLCIGGCVNSHRARTPFTDRQSPDSSKE